MWRNIAKTESAAELCVMVIDDDAVFNLMAKVLLRDTGIADNPISCTNGKEAINVLKQQLDDDNDTTFLLFLDINMPLVSGWEVLDTLNGLPYRENIHVVIVTSSIDKADREKANAYGQLINYLVKPIKRESLLALKACETLARFFPDRP